MSAVNSRPVWLTREGTRFRVAFSYDPELVNEVKKLPYAEFDSEAKSWTFEVCKKSVNEMRRWHYKGFCDVSVDTLIDDGETLKENKPAVLRRGSAKRPFIAVCATRDDTTYKRLSGITGASWDKKSRGVSYPPLAATKLAELVDRNFLDDPERLLTPADLVIGFDAIKGAFTVRGDKRADEAFRKNWPEKDVYKAWKTKNFNVAFSDPFTEEVYTAELARMHKKLQPDGMKLKLFDYQANIVAVAAERTGFAIFWTPGVGKTAAAIALGQELTVNRQETSKTIMVVPANIRSQWAEEIQKFADVQPENIVVINGTKKQRTKQYETAEEADWVILHYDVLNTDYDMIQNLVKESLIIADEAHRLKNPTAKRTKAMRKLGAKAKVRLAMTGTPVENDPGEWYSIIGAFTVPGIFGSPQDFFSRYSYPGKFGGWEGARNLDELRDRSKPHYSRYTKQQVAKHLPPLRVQHMPLDPSTQYANALRQAHRGASQEIKQAAINRVPNRPDANGVLDGELYEDAIKGAEMTATTMLRMLCTSPRIIQESDSEAAKALIEAGIIPDEDGPKMDELRERVKNLQEDGERVVIFSFSKRMVDLIEKRFTEDGIRYVTFTGDTSKKAREEAVKTFTKADSDVCAFVATDAASEGLNLGQQCSTLINVDVPWTPARLEQRSNRIHRVDGTHKSYHVINMTVSGTIEGGILRMIERKADLSDALLGETGGRQKTTGRSGKSIFEEVMETWKENLAKN